MRATLLLSLALSTLFFACQRGNNPSPQPNPIPTPAPLLLDTLWSKTLGLGIPLSLSPAGEVLCSDRFGLNPSETIYKLSGDSGRLLFSWNDYLTPNSKLNSRTYLPFNNHLIAAHNLDLHAIDTRTGQTAWKYTNSNDQLASQIFPNGPNHFYQGISDGNYKFELYTIGVENGQKSLVFSQEDKAKQYTHISLEMIQTALNSAQEKCLLLNLYYYTPEKPNAGYTQQICYNTLQQKIVWETKDDDYRPITYLGEAGYFFVSKIIDDTYYLQCYLVENGQVLWQQALGENAYQTLYLQDNKVVAVPFAFDNVKAFDISTGNKQWEFSINQTKYKDFMFWNENHSQHPPYLFAVFKQYLLVLNLQTGQEVYYQPIGFLGSSFYKGAAINVTKKLLYLQDKFTIRCFKLPKEVVF